MGEESVKGANMGVILIIFAAILALGLIIFMLARNMANEGLTNVAERLEAASAAEFTDFDQTVVVGQRVHAALNGFRGKAVAVLIASQGITDRATGNPFTVGTAIPEAMMNQMAQGDGNTILDDVANIQGNEAMIFAFGAVPGRNDDNSVDRNSNNRNQMPASSSGRTNDRIATFIQYNAILQSTDNRGVVDARALAARNRNSVIWWNDDHYVFSGSFRVNEDGRTMFNMAWGNTSRLGTTESIPAAARFHANLLRDENGVIIGVVFQQVSS
jgi:hypothetical protein